MSLKYRFWTHTLSDPKLYAGFNYNLFAGGSAPQYNGFYSQHYDTYLTVVDADTNQVIGYSTVTQFEDPSYGKRASDYKPFDSATVNRCTGHFRREHNIGTNQRNFYFETDGSDNEFSLNIVNCRLSRRFKIYLNTEININTNYGPWYNSQFYRLSSASAGTYSNNKVMYWGENVLTSASARIGFAGGMGTGMAFTKATVLKTEKTPADFLLDYSKLFGLYFIKNVAEKSIYICTRNTFFNGDVNDWNKRIDYSKDMTVTPILFDKKYYMMALDTPETKDALRYRSQYSQQYGQQRLSTGYNFNYDSNNFYQDNIYQQIVPVIDSDRLFRNFYDANGNPVPSWLVDNASYELFAGEESTSIDLYGRNLINPSLTVEWSQNGADV